MPLIPESASSWTVIYQVAFSMLAAAVAVLAATWSKSPVHLPLPSSPQRRWLRTVPVIAAAAIIGILRTWCMDCKYLLLLTVLLSGALIACIILMIAHHHLLRKIPDASTTLVVLCIGWSILGTLAVSSTATMLIVKQSMDEVYKTHPLTLWQIVEGHKIKPPDAIYLTAGLPAHFRGEMQECKETVPEMNRLPDLGQLKNGTYVAPSKITEEQQVTITVESKVYHDTVAATIILLPDGADIKRKQFTWEDEHKRSATFDLIVIAKNDSWVYRSDEFVERNRLKSTGGQRESRVRTPVCRPVLALAVSHAFDAYVDVICIGTASREGKQIEEDGRAGRRSRRIAQWVNDALHQTGRSKHVYSMNLGQYMPKGEEKKPKTEDDTAPERPVVLLGVVRAGEIDLRNAVRKVLDEHQENDFFKFLHDHYPGREIEDYRELPTVRCPAK